MERQAKPVRDAKKEWLIQVQKEDDAGAVRRSECECALARAGNRVSAAMGRPATFSVGRGVVIVEFETYFERYFLDDNAKAVIATFDDHDVFPVKYTVRLRPPRPGERLGARKNRSEASRTKGPKTTRGKNLYKPPLRHVKMPRLGP